MTDDMKTASDLARVERELHAMRRVLKSVEEFDTATALRVLQQCSSMRAAPAVIVTGKDSDGAATAP